MINSSSYIFSPGLRPSTSISMSSSLPVSRLSFLPDIRTIDLAKSSILTGSPISRTKTSPPFAIEPACITSCAASGMVIKKRVMSGSVSVIGPPSSICFLNLGTTDPEDPSTLPKRTIEILVVFWSRDFACRTSSAVRLVAPIALVGLTALSVEISTKLSTWFLIAISRTLIVPNTLTRMPCSG